MNTIRDIQQINDQELLRGIAGTAASWHAKYNQSAWIYIGNIDHTLTEGDIICVFSQYGEIDDIHLVRDETTGASRGFAFCKYSDTRSCVVAVDNFCGIQICGRSLRVDHVENYRLPKHLVEKVDQQQLVKANTTEISAAGHAYHGQELENEFTLQCGQDLFAPPTPNEPTLTTTQLQETTQYREDRNNNDDNNNISSSSRIQRKERKRQRKDAKHQKRVRKEDRKREHGRNSDRYRDDVDDDSRRKKKRKHHDR